MKNTSEQIAHEAYLFSRRIVEAMPHDEQAAVHGAVIAAATIGFSAGRSPEALRTILTNAFKVIAMKALASETNGSENQDAN